MKLQEFPFDQIRNGKKNIEVRLYDEKRQKIKIGDTVEFRKESEQIEVLKAEVVGLFRYKTFADLVANFDAKYFGYFHADDLIKDLFSFYTKEQETEYGVVGIKVKLL